MAIADYVPPFSQLLEENETLRKAVEFHRTTLRDQFAGNAMTTFLQDVVVPTKESRDAYFPMLSEIAYEMADAMLEARKETK